jgi:transcriptional regulator with XRE-family HTH domain
MTRAKQLRIDRGEGIALVAKNAGVHHQSLLKLEDGGEVGAKVLKAVGDYFGVQPSSLLLPPQFDDERSAA